MLGKGAGKGYLVVRLDMCEAFRKHYARFHIEKCSRVFSCQGAPRKSRRPGLDEMEFAQTEAATQERQTHWALPIAPKSCRSLSPLKPWVLISLLLTFVVVLFKEMSDNISVSEAPSPHIESFS